MLTRTARPFPNADRDEGLLPISEAGLAFGRELDIDPTRACCCQAMFIQHDPGGCVAGHRCGCRGFHRPDAREAIHRALDGEKA